MTYICYKGERLEVSQDIAEISLNFGQKIQVNQKDF